MECHAVDCMCVCVRYLVLRNPQEKEAKVREVRRGSMRFANRILESV